MADPAPPTAPKAPAAAPVSAPPVPAVQTIAPPADAPPGVAPGVPRLVVLQGFGSFGVDFAPSPAPPGYSSEVLPEHYRTWPDGALANRLKNGFVEYR